MLIKTYDFLRNRSAYLNPNLIEAITFFGDSQMKAHYPSGKEFTFDIDYLEEVIGASNKIERQR